MELNPCEGFGLPAISLAGAFARLRFTNFEFPPKIITSVRVSSSR